MKILTRLSKEVGYAQSVEYFLTQDSRILSGSSRRIGLILAMKHERTLKHVEFVRLDGELILAVLMIEKARLKIALFVYQKVLSMHIQLTKVTKAKNFLNVHIQSCTLQ
ncbi:hypothetical protein [Bartonella bacilliformis]|uniref:hypothetical protein n=1 Tax=Bartonella bacilliformis TaxID=774 RepID=UPI0004A02E27|nr:hypothetical protein [Bartonella bacilliformis]KEG23320.1 hypothetical protein H706_01210 [Bartonella bacilliformis CAR600-02]